jgi:hypothetical protein
MQSSKTVTFPFEGILHVEQTGKLSAKVYWPSAQTLQLRLRELLPSEEIYFPAGQFVHGVHEPSLAVAEYAPVPQGAHTRSVVLVPF